MRINPPIHFREASKADLPDILRLHAQPEMDDGQVLSVTDAEQVLDRMARYPDYRLSCGDSRRPESWAPWPCWSWTTSGTRVRPPG